MSENVAVVVLTLNPGDEWRNWIDALGRQALRPVCYDIDSSSSDSTVTISTDAGLKVISIDRGSFNHGATRNHAFKICSDSEFIVYMTQDAVLFDEYAIKNLIAAFDNPDIAAVYGRQLPRPGAGHIEAHARIFNYPRESHTRSIDDTERYGIKAAFLSNSFAAYRGSMLESVGGFPEDVIFGEDMYVAAKMLKAGHKIAYAADACVYHSHQYTLLQDMRRYFDMGVFHSHEEWLLEELGSVEGSGVDFVFSELGYLAKQAFWRVPESLLRNMLRYTGYKLGMREKCIPVYLKKKLSMNSGYFK